MPPKRQRLDAELVRRGLARSRQHAHELLEGGRVSVRGSTASKPATQVETADPVTVTEPGDSPDYVSRGAHKLVGALDHFAEVRVAGRVCLDAGASTGGFTDVLLRRGADRVIAVDVGYGQLAWSLRTDARVQVLDRQNVRALAPHQLLVAPQLVVGDLSFISLTVVMPALARCAADGADLLLMVKPQFEVGRGRLGAGGVVRDPRLRADTVQAVAEAAIGQHLQVHGAVASPLPGPSGNVEYFLWLTKPPQSAGRAATGLTGEQLTRAVVRAVTEGPQGLR
jgi:23S rRNA (cytidine1920-2'-O)/16S rRNA (cytidine1409-2'-O)-methyltransferase